MKALGILIWFICSTVGSALLNSWALAKIWSWFVAPQYGAGPSFGAWFGLAAIARIVLIDRDEKSKDDDTGDTALVKATLHSLATVVTVGILWGIGAVAGWLP